MTNLQSSKDNRPSFWMRLAWWRREDPEEIERLRRLDVNRRGRITVGQIVDLLEPEPPGRSSRLIVYKYQVAGVTYEVSQDVSGLPRVAPHAPEVLGQEASVKYDLQTPTNSIVACEEWCGLKSRDENQKSETSNQKAPESRA